MDSKVVQERMFLLNRFLAELADRQYFWESEEVGIFIKPENNLMNELKSLPRPTIEQLLERITVDAQINIQIDINEVKHYSNKIENFKKELVGNLPFLNTLKVFVIKQ